MNKIKQNYVVILAVIILGAGAYWLHVSSKDNITNTQNTSGQSQVVEVQKPKITSSDDKKTISYDGQTGRTALEILKDGAEITTQSSDFGDFVTGINGLEADSSKNYWSFYVNGAYASEGAGTYKTTDGEKIEWRLEDL